MASAIVAAPTSVIEWLSERHIVVGSRVGSCTVAYHPFGTIVSITSMTAITVKWDNGQTEMVTWSAISPLGFVAEVSPVAASASQWASAACHLERRSEWLVYRVDGVRYVRMISGTSGKVYAVRAD